MTPADQISLYHPASKSDIVRSTHILAVTLVAAQSGAWTSQSPRYQERTTHAEFVLDDVWKGATEEPEGSRVAVTIRQWQPAGPRFIAVPGPWSGKTLEPGARFVVFSGSDATDLAALLQEPACRKVEAAEVALPDLALAAQAGSPPLPLPHLVTRTFDQRASFGYLFAQYLSARLPELLFRHFEAFDLLMRLLEDAGLAQRARWILLTDLYSQFLLLDPAPANFVERLLAGTFRILAMPEGDALRAPMLDTYVPNLLGLEGGATRKAASEIFDGRPDVRRDAEAVLQAYPVQGPSKQLLDWLQS